MTRNDTGDLMRLISTLWGRRRPTEQDIDDWHAEMADVDIAKARTAVRTRSRTGQPGPSLSDVLSASCDRDGPQQRYTEDGHRYGPNDSRHPDYREPGCECWQDTRGAWRLCAMHTERANRWLAIIAKQKAERASGITPVYAAADPIDDERRF